MTLKLRGRITSINARKVSVSWRYSCARHPAAGGALDLPLD
jgi:hypothetical protein